jgi:hypothetical protein
MAKSPRKKQLGTAPRSETSVKPSLPDPKLAHGPYRPFTSDPGWNEAWWWLGFPLVLALFVLGTYNFAESWYMQYVLPEGHGILEVSGFLIPLLAFFIGCWLLFLPFVQARPLVFAVALIGTLSALYIAGEEISWGQHFFHWNTPEYWAEINRQQETNLHNTYAIFEKTPRSILEGAIFIGGLLVPIAALFWPWLRACRASLFLPAAALVPTALGALIFKVVDRFQQAGHMTGLIFRPSETIENYLYFFILGYLIVYARRINELRWRAA